MSDRVDSASKLIRASASRIYHAFATPNAMETWLPPLGMTGRMLNFDFREGGAYRMRLTYSDPLHASGKTTNDADEVKVRFVKLVEGKRIEQAVTFNSEDPAFSGEMRIVWVLEPVAGGTLLTVRCENAPAGIRPEDHQAALMSTLNNLAKFAEGAIE
jgi:uncharacterized protein YndB with AHSA1/START domain